MLNNTVMKTPLNSWHRRNGGRMVEFGGWDMPVQYQPGILAEHLATRKAGGLFDVSHMGRFMIGGANAIPFLQHVLSNDAEALPPGRAHYTLIPNEHGGVIDDAFLYRLDAGNYMLVVNAGNLKKDWDHLSSHASQPGNMTLEDHSEKTAMVAFQGPLSESILSGLIEQGDLPQNVHGALSKVRICDTDILIARTGYTGEPLCFELFVPAERVEALWTRLCETGEARGVLPVGLGARDTLRLEAGMPLYGHEFGIDPDGNEFPALAVPLVSIAVSFSVTKGEYVGRAALAAQADEVRRIREGGGPSEILPRRIRKMAILDRGIARHGDEILLSGEKVGVVTSGTTTPYWKFDGDRSGPGEDSDRRAIALAYVNTGLQSGQKLEVVVRKRSLKAALVKSHGRSDRPPYFRPVIHSE